MSITFRKAFAMTQIVYEAAVYEQTITYKNFKGETKSTKLCFALDPMQLLAIMSAYQPKKIRSGNPALNGKEAQMTDEDQLKMVRSLATKAAGWPSDDGDSWMAFENFDESLAGKAFLTKLATSDEDRKNFSEKVILSPFRAFIGYAEADESNDPKEVQGLREMLNKMENIFKTPDPGSESPEDRKARLMRELSMLDEKTINGTVVE